MSELTPVTFFLDWVMCAQFAGLCWASESGLYAAAGLDVTLVPWQDGHLSVADSVVAAEQKGSVAVGCCEDNLIVSRAAHDRSVKAFGSMLQGSPLVLMSRPEQRVRTFADLRGKRIGIHADGNRALAMVVSLEGIAADELDVTEVEFDLGYITDNRLDVLQGYEMTEPVQLAALGIAVDTLPIRHHRLHPFAQTYFTSSSTAQNSAGVLRSLLDASNAGWTAVLDYPDEAASMLAKVMGDTSFTGEQREMLSRVAPLVAGGLARDQIGTVNGEQWERNLTTYAEFGLIDPLVAISDVIAHGF
jgi:NitT/TauT family transport system substrate-binding protein